MEAALLALTLWLQQPRIASWDAASSLTITPAIGCIKQRENGTWYAVDCATGKPFPWGDEMGDLVLRWEGGPIRHGAPSMKIEKAKIARMCRVLVQYGDGESRCLTGWIVPGRPANPVDGDVWYGDNGKPRINGKRVRLKPSRKPRVQPQK